jgi:hypothetical protein
MRMDRFLHTKPKNKNIGSIPSSSPTTILHLDTQYSDTKEKQCLLALWKNRGVCWRIATRTVRVGSRGFTALSLSHHEARELRYWQLRFMSCFIYDYLITAWQPQWPICGDVRMVLAPLRTLGRRWFELPSLHGKVEEIMIMFSYSTAMQIYDELQRCSDGACSSTTVEGFELPSLYRQGGGYSVLGTFIEFYDYRIQTFTQHYY